MVRKTTTLRIDNELWKEIRKRCIDNNTTVSNFFETLARKELKKVH